MKNRGAITDAIAKLGMEVFERPVTQSDLRLLPYVDFCSKNRGFDPSRISAKEIEILTEWRRLGLIEYPTSPLNGFMFIALSRKFYDFMCKALWLGYVEKKIV